MGLKSRADFYERFVERLARQPEFSELSSRGSFSCCFVFSAAIEFRAIALNASGCYWELRWLEFEGIWIWMRDFIVLKYSSKHPSALKALKCPCTIDQCSVVSLLNTISAKIYRVKLFIHVKVAYCCWIYTGRHTVFI